MTSAILRLFIQMLGNGDLIVEIVEISNVLHSSPHTRSELGQKNNTGNFWPGPAHEHNQLTPPTSTILMSMELMIE